MKSQIGNRKTGPERKGAEPNRSGSETWEWEVLPPEVRQERASLESLFRWLALIMDDFLRFPGTKFRFGLDPIIGLLPGIGDVASAIISASAFVCEPARVAGYLAINFRAVTQTKRMHS